MKEGYKITELGEIPEDWDVVKVKDAFQIHNNLRLPLSEEVRSKIQGQYPYYGPTKIQDFINEYRVEGEYALIGEDGDHFLKWKEMPMTILTKGKFNVNNHAHLVKGVKNATSWFYYYFKHRDIVKHLTRQGAGRYKLTKKSLEDLTLAMPKDISEQNRICDFLKDIDFLIISYQKLFEKKNNIKEGAMQKLLSGNERLPGFSGDWQLKKIEQIGKCFAGGTPSTFKKEYWNGKVIWLPSGRVQNNILKVIDNEITITELGLRESAAKLINPTSVLIAITGATCGNIGLLNFSAAANQSVVAIEPNAKNDPTFLFYMLLTKRNEILSYQNGSAQGGINLKTVKNFCISVPDYEEQVAIADIFSSMEKELDALGKRLSKYQQLKQGVMQQLLTGKKRLTLKNE